MAPKSTNIPAETPVFSGGTGADSKSVRGPDQAQYRHLEDRGSGSLLKQDGVAVLFWSVPMQGGQWHKKLSHMTIMALGLGSIAVVTQGTGRAKTFRYARTNARRLQMILQDIIYDATYRMHQVECSYLRSTLL